MLALILLNSKSIEFYTLSLPKAFNELKVLLIIYKFIIIYLIINKPCPLSDISTQFWDDKSDVVSSIYKLAAMTAQSWRIQESNAIFNQNSIKK